METLIYPRTLFHRNSLFFFKEGNNHYKLTFQLSNPNLNFEKLFDFPFIKLVYEINKDIYDHVQIDVIDNHTAIIFTILKQMFEDAGLPQFYMYSTIHKHVHSANHISFEIVPIQERPFSQLLSDEMEMTNITYMIIQCKNTNQAATNANIEVELKINDKQIIPSFIEQMIGLILYKIFKRVCDFIAKL
jgi:hypothetical protein